MAAWRDRDDFSALVGTKRLSLCNALQKNVDLGHLGTLEAGELKETVEQAHISFFYPLVYRIDLETIESSRRQTGMGSGARGSHECLILDLHEEEFDLLFAHFRDDLELKRMVLDAHATGAYAEKYTLLDFTEKRLTTT